MRLQDSDALRNVLTHLFPSIQIEDVVPTPSGQRVVYFCSFSDNTDVDTQRHWHEWGQVVLKVSQDIHPSVLARLEKEIEILNSLDTPFYPKLYYYDVFSEDPETETRFQYRLFITIEERVNGPALSSCRERFSTEPAVARLLLQLVDGLRHLWEHPQRIVHRDLKPDNILICADGTPVIIDLGIIREEGNAGLTSTHAEWGPCSAPYASPEQARNDKRNTNFRSDFFALGTLSYELLTGQNPFMHHQNDSFDVVIDRVLNHTPDSLVGLGRASEGFSALVGRLMAKEPYQRFRSVGSLRAYLLNFAG